MPPTTTTAKIDDDEVAAHQRADRIDWRRHHAGEPCKRDTDAEAEGEQGAER